MKISLGNIRRAYVYDVKVGAVQVKKIMYGGRQIWPDNTERVATMALDMAALDGTDNGLYWDYGIGKVQSVCNAKRYIKVKAGGREYMVQSTFGNWKRAAYNAGVLDFLGNGPVRGALRVGDVVEMQIVMPGEQLPSIGGGWDGYDAKEKYNWAGGRYVTGTYTLALPHAEVWGTFTKSKKHTNTGNRILVQDANGKVLLDVFRKMTGHSRAAYCWQWGVVDYAGEVTLKVVPHRARGAWSGYFVYPAFTRTIRLKVTALTYTGEGEA